MKLDETWRMKPPEHANEVLVILTNCQDVEFSGHQNRATAIPAEEDM